MDDPVTGDLQSIIFGLQLFDLADVEDDNISEVKQPEFSAMVEKVVLMRNQQKANREGRRFDISTTNRPHEKLTLRVMLDLLNLMLLLMKIHINYRARVEKFKELSPSVDTSNVEFGNRSIPEERQLKLEASKKKKDEEKLMKWESLGYRSLSVKDVIPLSHSDSLSDQGSVNFVYGDCTHPSKVGPTSPAVVFSCVDNSGSWGHEGMFDALSLLSTTIPDAYQRASEFDDLHLGDLHLIIIDDQHDGQQENNEPAKWVVLAVVQSYSARRKVPRSSISIPDPESCLHKASL